MGTTRIERRLNDSGSSMQEVKEVMMKTSSDEVSVVSDDDMEVDTLGNDVVVHVAQHSNHMNAHPCDACDFCDDSCHQKCCVECQSSSTASESRTWGFSGYEQRWFTPCQIRRHNHVNSVWIVAGETVYDVTSYLKIHPGGTQCILNKAGDGLQDCTRDLQFHSDRGKKIFQKFAIGKVRPCPGCTNKNLITTSKVEKQRWFLW
jgi:cytochrome b involved in lipid metabolism